jgi:hypothetical protein
MAAAVVVVKHQLLIFDRNLCDKKALADMVVTSLKSNLLLATHFDKQHRRKPMTLSICVGEFTDTNVDIQPVLLPTVPASSTMADISKALMKNFPSPRLDGNKNNLSGDLKIPWEIFAKAVLPNVNYPPQDAYR